MQFISTKIVINIESGQILEKEGFWYEGPVSLCCGASAEQRQVFQMQKSAAQMLTSQAQQIFGSSSQIFSDLTSAFQPVLAAGPDQQGYSAAEMANLKSQAITQTGQAYKNAAQAAGERAAAAGGGVAVLPSGVTEAQRGNIATAGAAQTAQELSAINTESANLGRQNWLAAAQVLSGAPSVYNAATSAGEAATGALSGAATTANQITQANQSWMQPVASILGGIGGKALGGLTGGDSGGTSIPGSASLGM